MKVYCTPLNGRSGFEAVYSLLEHAFYSCYCGHFPVIKKTPAGKPFFPDRPEIHFSLSHARTHVLCALSNSPVGADIESPRSISRRATAFFCSSAELALFEPLDLWVLKESYIKMIGETLFSIRKLRFSRRNDGIVLLDTGAQLSHAPNETQENRSPTFRLYRVGDCRAAVCSISETPPISIDLI